MGNEWIIDGLNRASKCKGEQPAVYFYKKRGRTEICTFAELTEKVILMAERIKSLGLRRGDRVAVIFSSSTIAYINILSLTYAGITFVPVNDRFPEYEMLTLLDRADVACIFTEGSIYSEKLLSASVAVFDETFEKNCLNNKPIRQLPDRDPDAFAIVFSSGTTSVPKGVVIGYEQEEIAGKRLLCADFQAPDRALMIFPVYHVAGLTMLFGRLVIYHQNIGVMEELSSAQLKATLQLYRPDSLVVIPGIMESMKNAIEEGLREKKFIRRLIPLCGYIRKKTGINIGRFVFRRINELVFGGEMVSLASGGGPIDPDTLRFFWNIGLCTHNMYGSTEGNVPIIFSRGKTFETGIGRLDDFFPGSQFRILDPQPSGIGEILLKCDCMMKGYFRDPALTAASRKDGFFKTGDLGKIENGILHICGRAKNSVYLGNGEKISLEEAELAVKRILPGSISFALAAVPSGNGYDELHLCIEGSADDYPNLLSLVNRNVFEDYRCKAIHYFSHFARTSVGKLNRGKLITLITEGKQPAEPVKAAAPAEPYRVPELTDIIAHYCNASVIRPDCRLAEDLGMGSLDLFSLFIEIEEIYKIRMPDSLDKLRSVRDLQRFLSDCGENGAGKDSTMQYPHTRTPGDDRFLRRCMKRTKRSLHLQTRGTEHLPDDTNVIFCSNHKSLLDPVVILTALGENYAFHQKYVSMAYSPWRFTKLFRAVCAIPVSVFGDRMPAIRCAQHHLEAGCDLIMFPEGHLKSEIAAFKGGAATLSMTTGVPVLPLYIDRKQKNPEVRFGSLLHMEPGETVDRYSSRIRQSVIGLSELTYEENCV